MRVPSEQRRRWSRLSYTWAPIREPCYCYIYEANDEKQHSLRVMKDALAWKGSSSLLPPAKRTVDPGDSHRPEDNWQRPLALLIMLLQLGVAEAIGRRETRESDVPFCCERARDLAFHAAGFPLVCTKCMSCMSVYVHVRAK